MIARTSAYALATTCSARDNRPAGRRFGRAVETVTFHDPIAGEHLLGLGVRTVGDERHAPLRP